VIEISMIPMTYDPMEGIFVDVSGPYPMAGTQMGGTHGEMISSNLHGAKIPPNRC
jgi:hypothetical protein